jgi:hypothetical protein
MGVQLVGIGAEFVCIFVIAAGVIYDLEFGVNPAVHNLNDTLYWAILTLTGIGQPFEVVTAGGRVATVISIIVALIVVPGQLAKLATISGAQNLMNMMADDEDEDGEGDDDYVIVASSNGNVSRSTDIVPDSAEAAKVFNDRQCEQCGLEMHQIDARFCRRCAARLPEAAETENIYKKRSKRRKAAQPPPMVEAALPGMRLGIDATSTIGSASRMLQQSTKNRRDR